MATPLEVRSMPGREAPDPRPRRGRAGAAGAAVCTVLALCACSGTVNIQNVAPAQQLARESEPPGSVYVGWRVFNDRCAGCHGVDATGPARMPDLLVRVREMGARRFTNLVLQRYDWSRSASPAGTEEAARTDLVEQALRRGEPPIAMPAWQDEPQVNAHVLDLYAYVSARADGVQGPGRPPRPAPAPPPAVPSGGRFSGP
jgi:hypothetical protein